MAAEAQAEVQALLAFLTREAKVPLAEALPKYNQMRKHGLTTPDAIAKSDIEILKSIFSDEKVIKQIVAAARRLSNPKKRAASTTIPTSSKQIKLTPDKEEDLSLPETTIQIDELRNKVVETNRAPLFLAFALVVSRYTLPDQPLSSRLSLAQGVTSAGAQSKAKYIGLTNSTAEDEGWAHGQPKVRLMGRDIAVMRRHIAPAIDLEDTKPEVKSEEFDGQDKSPSNTMATSHEAFWGINLEALKKSNGPLVAGKMSGSTGPPIHRPEAARAYLLKSIDLIDAAERSDHEQVIKTENPSPSAPVKNKRLTAAGKAVRKEEAVAILLKSINHICASWSSTLTNDELDRRASSWYAKVRPDVEGGQAGWGQRGKVPLDTILALAKDP